MAELPPGFEIPTPQPGAQRPPMVRIAAWILIVGGAITALGGGVLVISGTAAPAGSLGLAYLAFGAAQAITGSRLLRMRAAFRVVGIVLASIGVVNDTAQLVAGSRWQLLALLAHLFAVYALMTSAEAFQPSG